MAMNFIHIKKVIERRKTLEKCEMCGTSALSLRFLWVGMLTGTEVKVCRDCAYKEEFRTKKRGVNKKNKVIENYFNIV